MTSEAPKVLLYFLRDTLHIPYPAAVWLSGLWDTFYSIAITPVGIFVAALFLATGFLRFGIVYVAVLAAVAGAILVELNCEDWEHYSYRLQYYYIIQIMTASLALCFSANFIGRRLRPNYF